MKTIIIPQNCNSNITDIASVHFTREIKLRKGCKYAFVSAAYANFSKTFKSASAVAKFAHKSECVGRIIDEYGNYYGLNYYNDESDFEIFVIEKGLYEVVE